MELSGLSVVGLTRTALNAAPSRAGSAALAAASTGPCACDAATEAPEADRVELSSTTDAADELSEDELAEVRDLEQRDTEVRRHEQAHLSAAGTYAQGNASFEYQTGPDGQQYAVGGEVQIDTSPVEGDPDATIAKMEQVRAAALSPAQPSAQDQRVAAEALAAIAEARNDARRDGSDSSSAASSANAVGTLDVYA